MATLLVRSRNKAYIQQSGLCIYCDVPMWLNDPGSYALLHGMTLAQARHFKCTAEHLKAREDGGTDHAHNIAAACLYCNSRRHRVKSPLDPISYKALIARKLSIGKWNQSMRP